MAPPLSLASTEEMHRLVSLVSWGMVGFGLFSFAALMLLERLTAPYGRYTASNGRQKELWWGPALDARIAWMAQEIPSLLVPLYLAAAADRSQLHTLVRGWSPRLCLAGAFLVHYINRSLIYPWQIKGGKETAFTVWAMATAFCTCNGLMQGWFLLHQMPPDTPWQWHHVVGLAVWLVGWLGNMHCDAILRSLRSSTADKGYKVPRGGLFEFVSAGNYFAETVEWLGYAIASGWELAPVAFAFATFCNLAPRAHSHHQWYKAKFKESYPAGRKAYIPFIW